MKIITQHMKKPLRLLLLYLLLTIRITAQVPDSLMFIGRFSLQSQKGDTLIGISGIEHIKDDRFYIVSDYKGIYEANIRFNNRGIKKITVNKLNQDLKWINGKDIESVRTINKQLRFSSEENSVIYTVNKKGDSSSIVLPGIYKKNLQNNKGIEGMCLSTDGNIWIINEAPLKSDSSLNIVRLSKIDIRGNLLVQYAYDFGEAHRNEYAYGITELLQVNEYSFLTIERNFDFDKCANTIKIFSIDIKNAKDINKIGINQDKIMTNEMVQKRCIATLGAGFIPFSKNIEGMCWADDKEKYLILVTDNNYNFSYNKSYNEQKCKVLPETDFFLFKCIYK